MCQKGTSLRLPSATPPLLSSSHVFLPFALSKHLTSRCHPHSSWRRLNASHLVFLSTSPGIFFHNFQYPSDVSRLPAQHPSTCTICSRRMASPTTAQSSTPTPIPTHSHTESWTRDTSNGTRQSCTRLDDLPQSLHGRWHLIHRHV